MNEAIKTQIQDQSKGDRRIKMVLEYIPNDQIQVYMNVADVIVLPFQDILTSGSALLAMGFAKAIIAPRLGCMTEILNDKGAILYNPNVENGMYQALDKAYQLDLESMGRDNFNN